MKLIVFRIGHRISRDHRISTHCGLVARALGADGIVYSGDPDDSAVASVTRVSEQWGGNFEVAFEKAGRKSSAFIEKRVYDSPLDHVRHARSE